MKPWDTIQLQDNNHRYTIILTSLWKKELIGTIKDTQVYPVETKETIIFIALPNRRDKAELITQKLTEIGVSAIVFRPASRSVLKSTPDKKQERIRQIALEASEQSFRTSLPSITFLEKWDEKSILWHDMIIVWYQWGMLFDSDLFTSKKVVSWIIGPEWWFTQEELQYFQSIGTAYNLWSNILRMETAAIIGARLLHNQ